MAIHVVTSGETVDLIAAAYGIPVSELVYANQIPAPYRLAIGQALFIPSNVFSQAPALTPRQTYVGGYAYPFISPYVLEQTLPYLDYLYIFSYGFTPEGDLIPPSLPDDWMIRLAREYRTDPVLTLTPLDAFGRFNNNLITSVVNDLDARRRLKNQIIETMLQKGMRGLDIDFEYIKASDRDAFVDFVVYMQESVSALGYLTSVALAPKTSADQPGLLYEGKDYAALGAAADYVLLMTYEWGYKYSMPMAVAPVNKVRQVLDYAVTVIPREKIHMGIPNYGYDWPLPYVQGVTAATTIGNVEAVQIAIENSAAISFDTLAQSPFFTYTSRTDGISHEVWFEDVRSISAKFDLVREYGLRGMSYWQIMQLFRANWLLLKETFGPRL